MAGIDNQAIDVRQMRQSLSEKGFRILSVAQIRNDAEDTSSASTRLEL
jgi:hypothetical protein